VGTLYADYYKRDDRDLVIVRRHELTDEQWELIEELFPENAHRGGQWKDHRTMVNAMLWWLRTGAPWRDLPERYGPWKSVYDRFDRWSKDGTFDRIIERLQVHLDEEGNIDWDLFCVDGTSIRASRAAAGAAKKGAPNQKKNPKITRWVAQEADSPARSIWLLAAKAYR
jgi:transposase